MTNQEIIQVLTDAIECIDSEWSTPDYYPSICLRMEKAIDFLTNADPKEYEALKFGVHYGFKSPNFESETCDEAWVAFQKERGIV